MDHIVFSNASIDKLKEPESNALKRDAEVAVFEDFEEDLKSRWENGGRAPQTAGKLWPKAEWTTGGIWPTRHGCHVPQRCAKLGSST